MVQWGPFVYQSIFLKNIPIYTIKRLRYIRNLNSSEFCNKNMHDQLFYIQECFSTAVKFELIKENTYALNFNAEV